MLFCVPLIVPLWETFSHDEVMSAKKEAKYYYVYYIEKNIYIWIVEFLVDTYNVFFFQRHDITICFTLLGSSDVLNWVCLFVCLLLESFGTFWKKAVDLNFNLDLKLIKFRQIDGCLLQRISKTHSPSRHKFHFCRGRLWGMLRRGLAQDICNLSCSVIYPRYLIAQVIIALKEQIFHAWNKNSNA